MNIMIIPATALIVGQIWLPPSAPVRYDATQTRAALQHTRDVLLRQRDQLHNRETQLVQLINDSEYELRRVRATLVDVEKALGNVESTMRTAH